MKTIKNADGSETTLDDAGNIAGARVPMFAMDSMDLLQQAVATTVAAIAKKSARDEMIDGLQFRHPTADSLSLTKKVTPLSDFREMSTSNVQPRTEVAPQQTIPGNDLPAPDDTFPAAAKAAYEAWKKKLESFWRDPTYRTNPS